MPHFELGLFYCISGKNPDMCDAGDFELQSAWPCLEAQQRYFFISRNTCSDSIAKLFRVCFNGVPGYRTNIAPFWGSASPPYKVSRDMGYRSDSIAISRDMGPLRAWPCLQILVVEEEFGFCHGLSDPRNRNRQIASDFQSQFRRRKLSRKNRNEIAVLQMSSESQ